MLEFKIDVMTELKKRGWTTTRIRKESLLGEKTISDIRVGKVPGGKGINNLCYMLGLQPGSIIRYIPDPGDDSTKTD